jgi:nucleotide-binding universal stress UspA family protein
MSVIDISNTGRIVVGVDGSPTALAALRWAVHQAKATGDTVDAVIAWENPSLETAGYGWSPLTDAECSEYIQDATKTVEAAIAEVSTPGGPQIRSMVLQGTPAQVLLEASADADLLVVGSRGQGLLVDALVGSLSHHIFQHAHCPVVIMRGVPATQARVA